MSRGTNYVAVAALAAASVAGNACLLESEKPLSASEARQALEETAAAFQAEALVANTVELNTNFTIGGAVEAAAQELRDFVLAQLPCAEVTLEDTSLSVTYGANGSCAYHGHTYQGTHTITLVSVDDANIVIDHDWDEVTNGIVMVDGSATVTWAASDQTRRVQHQLSWTDLSRDASFTGSGDRLQGPLDMDWGRGLVVAGHRSWSSDRGDWQLTIEGIRARWDDPVPEAGIYGLETPFDGKSMTLGFERVDADTIAVTVESGNRSFSFNVNKLGIITE